MDQTQVQKIMNLNLLELTKQVQEEYLKAYKAESFLYFEIRYDQPIEHYKDTNFNLEIAKNIMKYSKYNEKLKNIIQSYQLEKKYELYINDNEAWRSQHIKEIENSLDIKINKSKNYHLRVV